MRFMPVRYFCLLLFVGGLAFFAGAYTALAFTSSQMGKSLERETAAIQAKQAAEAKAYQAQFPRWRKTK